ncbi:MAG TPA: hypothetical protein VIE36_16815 [Methylomirabilota bacterium]|jgi:hypothetical protein
MKPSQSVVDGQASIARTGATIAVSMARIRFTEGRIEVCRRLLRPVVRGGADDPSDARLTDRDRVLRFIAHLPPNEVPRIYAGPSMGGKKCGLCGRDIMLGATEYELEFHAVMFRLDRCCLALWHSQAARN